LDSANSPFIVLLPRHVIQSTAGRHRGGDVTRRQTRTHDSQQANHQEPAYPRPPAPPPPCPAHTRKHKHKHNTFAHTTTVTHTQRSHEHAHSPTLTLTHSHSCPLTPYHQPHLSALQKRRRGRAACRQQPRAYPAAPAVPPPTARLSLRARLPGECAAPSGWLRTLTAAVEGRARRCAHAPAHRPV
jgi:hypothetical protein